MASSPLAELPFEPPLTAEPILGWRVWRLERHDGTLMLVSVTRPDVWPPRTAMHAVCASGHPGPRFGCTCGLYAASSPDALARAGVVSASTPVVGAIAMWGTVVEHANGARSRSAYPARLRLICGTCAARGFGQIDAISVGERHGSLVAGCRWHRPGGVVRPAAEIQAELLSTYAVDLLPLERVRRPFRRGRLATTTGGRNPLQVVVIAILMLIRFAIGAFFTLMIAGWLLALAAGIVGGVVGLIRGHAADPAAAAVAPPSPVVLDLAPPTGWAAFEAHRRIPVPRPPKVPDVAILCGVREGRTIELSTCDRGEQGLLGLAERARPRGPATDCAGSWDAYSRGDRFWICWSVFSPSMHVRPWATSPNPWKVPVAEGGAMKPGA